MILVIDNYDSFTFNLVQALQAAGATVRVVRNDAIDRSGIEALASDEVTDLNGIVISPGPGDPDDAGVSMAAVRVARDRSIPLLGVCLGMQSMAQVYGAYVWGYLLLLAALVVVLKQPGKTEDSPRIEDARISRADAHGS